MSITEVRRQSTRTTGQGTSQLGVRVPAQNYNELRRQHIRSGTLFEDPYFPASNESLSLNTKLPFTPVWKRPSEISANSKFYVGGTSRFDVVPGMLDDHGFIAAMASLTQNRILLRKNIPETQQSFEVGILKFRFYYFGVWVDIVIDDRLPTHNGRLIFTHSTDEDEFWSALFEKAYAKLYGGYGAIEGVTTAEAMTDVTGGVIKSFDLKNSDSSLYTQILHGLKRLSIMCCSIKAERPQDFGVRNPFGLIKGHIYFVTKATTVEIRGKSVKLIRLRNASGSKTEWHGNWSDNDSDSWRMVPASVRQDLLEIKGDGEFWMDFESFCKHFMEFEICSISTSKLDEDDDRKSWNSVVINGQWSNDNGSAGGCRNYPTFVNNPQYVVELTEDADGDGKCSVLIALMQKNRHSQKKLGAQDLSIGFTIYKAPSDGQTILTKQYVQQNYSIGTSGSLTNDGEVRKSFDLDPGRYIIVPTTFKPREEGDFLLRIVTEYFVAKDKEVGNPLGGKIYEMFKSIAGADGDIDAEELEDVLSSHFNKDLDSSVFSIDACRAMIAMLDKDNNGLLDFEEYTTLLKTIMSWKKMFSKYDKDRSGTLDKVEVASALRGLGYDLSAGATSILFNRFARRRRYMRIDDFFACLSRIATAKESFEVVKSDDGSKAEMTKDQFFKITGAM